MAENTLSFSHVSRNFGAVEALRDVSFTVARGETVALLGPNGAGKSTAISLLLGLRSPSDGHVEVLGANPRGTGGRSAIGAMLQESSLPPGLKVSELLAFQRSLYGRPLSLASVAERARIGDLMRQRMERLSGGQRRRVLFALAICGDPDVLFLDEPTAAMDTESRMLFWRQMDELAANGRTILFTTHYLEEADRHARRVLLLNGGRLAADAAPEELRRGTGRSTLRFSTSPAWARRIAQLLPLAQVQAQGQEVRIVTEDSEGALRLLLAQGVPLEGLEVSAGSLEAALMELKEGVDPR